ncbi:MAG: FlgD immunoglobulin-like domain containing protein, partial [Candidatus Zixiibacteriota bacterium]
MDAIFQHETAHSFGAADEYSSGCGSGDCDDRYGYLKVVNGNCESCNPNWVNCSMLNNYWDYCTFTRGQIGWKDFDGDGPNDPIDPHTRFWASLSPLNPGDRVSIALNETFLKSIAVTADNSDATGGSSFIIWDATNTNYAEMIPQCCYYWGSGGTQQGFSLNAADPNVIPIISNFSKTSDQKINWSLSNSWAYIRCRILNSSGAEVLYPIFDKLHRSMQTYQIDLRPLPIGTNYRAEFLAWLPYGTNYTTSYTFNRDVIPLNTPTLSITRNNDIILNWNDNNTMEDGYALERQLSGGEWVQIALLPQNSITYTDLTTNGSATYSYRVKAFNVDTSAYSNSITITTRPKPPTNFSAQVVTTILGGSGASMQTMAPVPDPDPDPGPGPTPVPTNKVILSWSAPINQNVPIDSYRVEAYYKRQGYIVCCVGGNCFLVGRILDRLDSMSIGTDTRDTFCLDLTDTLYNFYIKSFAGQDSSILWNYRFVITACGIQKESTLVGPTASATTGPECICGSCLSNASMQEVNLFTSLNLPKEFTLEPNSPNPFNPSTTIRYALPQEAKVELRIYNILGQVVRKLVNEEKPAGFHQAIWDGRDEAGRPVSTGIYLYQIRAGNFVKTMKMTLVK